jgi:hypothetical protein
MRAVPSSGRLPNFGMPPHLQCKTTSVPLIISDHNLHVAIKASRMQHHCFRRHDVFVQINKTAATSSNKI